MTFDLKKVIMSDGNPFHALFSFSEDVVDRERIVARQKQEICGLLSRIFLFTAAGMVV